MAMSSVAEIDAIAEQLYASPDPGARQQAQEQLKPLTEDGSDGAVLAAVLQQSSNQYALLFAAQGLVAWCKANAKWMTTERQRELVTEHCAACLKRIVLADAPRHVVLSMMAAYAKLTKLGFEKEPYLREACDFPVQLLTSTAQEDKLHFMALLLLDAIVNECGRYDASKSQTYMNFALHRRCSNNFRDECLQAVFTASLAELERVSLLQTGVSPATPSLGGPSPTTTTTTAPSGMDGGVAGSAGNAHYVTAVTDLVRDCLSYDFMAILVDETEDAISAQFPSSWKSLVLADSTRSVLWGQHAALPYPYCASLMAGLSSLCGIRRTFFDSTEERVQYLDFTLTRLTEVVRQSRDGRLKNPHYVSIFAEAGLRLIAPFGYRDLRQSTAFEGWVEAMRELSYEVLAIPFGQDGSFTTATTLMNFWSRLTTSRRMFVTGEESAKDLELISPDLAFHVFQSRVNLNGKGIGASAGESGGPRTSPGSSSIPPPVEDDEDYEGLMDAVSAQSEAFGTIVMLEPLETVQKLADYLNRGVGPSILNHPSATAWLFYLAGSLVRHVLANVETSAVDACSSFFVFCVDCANHRRLAAVQGSGTGPGSLFGGFVERAVLFFLTNVQLVLTSSRLHAALSAVVTNAFQTRAQLFQFILNNTGHNIMRGVTSMNDEDSAAIIKSSVDLIKDACRDIPSSLLSELNFELPPVVELPLSQSPKTYKLRSNLYSVLWLLSNKGLYSSSTLHTFLEPIVACIRTSLNGGSSTSPMYTAGWMRDLRGVSDALHDDTAAFTDFVEWFCDQASSFHTILAGPAGDSPMVIISFLRFIAELVNCRGGRLSFAAGEHSPCGLLLFKHLCAFLQQIIERCITEEHVQIVASGGAVDGAYEVMMKPLGLSMDCLRKCVQDGFVPFGAMWFYNDDTYDSTLLGLLRMLVVFPARLFKEYPKVAHSVADLLRTVTEEQTYKPLTKLSSEEMETIISFVMYLCDDVDTQTVALLHGLSFLAFIAGLVKEVKALSLSPALGAVAATASLSGTPPPSPMQLPSYYAVPGSGRVSGTPGGRGGGSSGGYRKQLSFRQDREALARLLEPLPNLWQRLITVAMNVIACQDRALSVSCSVVYPILEAHPPFWFEFVDSFVLNYPERKQKQVREAFSALTNAADTQERFFSEIFAFRQQLRSL